MTIIDNRIDVAFFLQERKNTEVIRSLTLIRASVASSCLTTQRAD